MPRHLWPDIAAGLLVAIGFIIGLVLAYRRGFRDARGFQSDAFDFLATGFQLDGSRWRSELNGEVPDSDAASIPPEIVFRQAGSRLTGEGQDADGTRWRLEAVAQGKKLWCLVRSQSGEHAQTSAWMLFAEQPDRLRGYVIRWQRGLGAPLLMRGLQLTRCAGGDPLAQTTEFALPPAKKS